MLSECSNQCTKALMAIKDTELFSTIKDFITNIEAIKNNSSTLQQFYDYIQDKYKVPCDTGMLFIEKVMMIDMLERYKLAGDLGNEMVNEKMFLYNWIEPTHLDLKCDIDVEVYHKLREIRHTNIPTEKINVIMKVVRKIYEIIGKDSGHDNFFPYFVYCLIKARIKDLQLQMKFIKMFKRKYAGACVFGCNHGFGISVSCECTRSFDYGSEREYYLISLEAAIEFIQKLEYYNLSISLSDFEKELFERAEKMDLIGKAKALEDFFK